MSFADRLVLWLHIGFAIFTIGPVTVAIMSTPRYIRQRNLVILRYLYRITRLFAILALGVLIAGLILARLKHDFSQPWLTVSMTLFVVSLVLLVLIVRDQHRAIATLEDAEATAAEVAAAAGAGQAGAQTAADAGGESPGPAQLPDDPPAAGAHLGHVERGRIVSLGGVVSLIWLVVLVLMVWNG
jgi:Ca2+/Na+ antiporter